MEVGGWSYGEYIHRLVVLSLTHATCCVVTWTVTVLLLKRVFQNNSNDPKHKVRKWKDLQKTQILGIAVCVGCSFSVPLSCVYWIFFTVERYELNKNNDETNNSELNRIHIPGLQPILYISLITIFGSILSDIYLNILKLDVFDDTISELSQTRKLVYRRVFYLIVLVAAVYCILAFEPDRIIVPFLIIFSLLCSSILGCLAYDFSVKLKAFIRVTRQSIASEQEIGSRSVELSSSKSQMSAPNLELLRVIIKQSLLSLIKIVSIVLCGFMFAVGIAVLTGVYFAYSYIICAQLLSVLPLCVYLSFDFAQPEYHRFCHRIHDIAESQAVGSFQG